MQPVIDLLYGKHLIWQGSDQVTSIDSSPTGYAELDEKLGGGFPEHGVIEITSEPGIGELRLLTPYIKEQGKQRLSVFINPPGYICSEYLLQQGMDLHRVVMIFPRTEKEALWSAEQCLKSGCCGSVTLWHPSLEVHQARRLQVASETGRCLHFLFKTRKTHQISLPVSMSMQLHPHANGIEVTLNKRKGGWLNTTFVIDMTQRWGYLSHSEKQAGSTYQNSTYQNSAYQNKIAHFPELRRGNA